MTHAEFRATIRKANRLVASWPEWKRRATDLSGSPTRGVVRRPLPGLGIVNLETHLIPNRHNGMDTAKRSPKIAAQADPDLTRWLAMAITYAVEVATGAILGTAASWIVLSQVDLPDVPGAETIGVGILISLVTAAITAFGTTFFQPWLRTKDLLLANADLQERLKKTEAHCQALESQIETQAEQNRVLMDSMFDLSRKTVKQAERNLRLAGLILISNAKIVPGSIMRSVAVTLDDVSDDSAVNPSLLLIDGSMSDRESLSMLLDRNGYTVTASDGVEDAITRLGRRDFDVVIVDWKLDDGTALDVLTHVRDAGLKSRVIVTHAEPLSRQDSDAVRDLSPAAILKTPLQFDECLLPALRGEACRETR